MAPSNEKPVQLRQDAPFGIYDEAGNRLSLEESRNLISRFSEPECRDLLIRFGRHLNSSETSIEALRTLCLEALIGDYDSQPTAQVDGGPDESDRPIFLGMLVIGPILVLSGLVLMALRGVDILGDLLCKGGQFIILIASLFTWNFDCKPTPGTYSGILLFLAGFAISVFGATQLHNLEKKGRDGDQR